jgi:plasmid maintenance system antidote protein VapI
MRAKLSAEEADLVRRNLESLVSLRGTVKSAARFVDINETYASEILNGRRAAGADVAAKVSRGLAEASR